METTPKNFTCELTVGGMDCPDCAVKIEQNVAKLKGVKAAKVDFINSKLRMKFDREPTVKAVEKQVKSLGYTVEPAAATTRVSTFLIEGMDCAEEERAIRKKLEAMDGVEELRFNLVAQKLTISHRLTEQQIVRSLKEIGFRAIPEGKEKKAISFWERYKRLILTITSGLFAAAGIIHNQIHVPDSFTIPLYLVAMLSSGFYVAKKGLLAVKNLSLDINFLMTLAVVGAAIIGEWDEGAMVIFLFAVANLLESYSMDRARNAIKSLMDLSPKVAAVKRNGEQIELPVEEVGIGDVMIVKPGERIPLDGMVVAGRSSVNQAPITGESMPVKKKVKDEVYAGTINEKGALEVEVTRLSQDTTLARIIHMVEEAQAQKAPSQNFVDRFARYYTPVVVVTAVLMATLPPLIFGAAFTIWFYRALVLLVIACPCALVISTPVTIVSGLTAAARNGILIKGGVYLENAGALKVMAFDKTGTLTYGEPMVTQIVPINQDSEHELLQIAASVESRSEHPLAEAILKKAKIEDIKIDEVSDFQSITGKGVQAQLNGTTYFVGNHRLFEEKGWCNERIHQRLALIEKESQTAVLVGNQQGLLGIFAIADQVREEAQTAIEQLHRGGIKKTVMLTGDNHRTAAAIARKISVDEFQAELLPQDKVTAVKALLAQYGKVAMVGDGINDSPALAMATIGIAMGTAGTDTALETADIALMADDLSNLPVAMKLSRKALRIIKQNIAFALLIKGVFLAMTPIGWATLWMAVFADMGASLMVIFNGLRVLKKSA